MLLGIWPLMSQETAPSLQVGLGLTGFSYAGDLTVGETNFRRAYPGGTFSLQFVGKKPLQLQVQVGFGKGVEQQDTPELFVPSEVSPNTFVQTSLFFTELRLRYRFFHRKRVQPFLGLGVGMLFFTPRDGEGNFLSENIFTRPALEEYETTVPVIPLMGGILVNINDRLAMSLDYTRRLVSSDYLDNIGQLGRHAGNDALHAASLTAYLRLQPSERVSTPAPPPIPEPIPVVAVADSGWLDMWEALYPHTTELPPQVEGIPLVSADLFQQLVFADLPPGTSDWLRVESRALRLQQVLTIAVPTPATLDELATSLNVQAATIQALNPSLQFPLDPNTPVKVPDMRGI